MTIAIRVLAATLCFSVGAIAAPPEPISIVLPDCKTPPVDPASLTPALQLELHGSGFAIAPASNTRVVVQSPECRPDARELMLTIEFRLESGTDAALHTRVLLADVLEASRARTVALAVAELVRVARQFPLPESASAPEPTLGSASPPVPKLTPPPGSTSTPHSLTNSLPPPGPSSTTPPAGKSNQLARRFPSLGIGAGTQVAWLMARESAFVGGQLEAQQALSPRWRPRMALALAWNSVDSAYGSIGLTAATGRLALDAILLERPGLALGPELSLVTISALGQSRLGVSESTQTLRFYSGGLRLGLEVPIYGALSLMVNASAALALNTVVFTAGGEDAAKFTGLQGTWGTGLLLMP